MAEINVLYLIFQFGRFIGFFVLAALMLRDIFRGENHFTPGIFVFSLGNVVNSMYSVIETITINELSPEGFIVWNISNQLWVESRLASLTAGAGLMFIGGIFIIYATVRKK